MSRPALIPLEDVTDRLGALLESRPAAEDALFHAMRDLTVEHAALLEELGSVRVMALDPCPRCSGLVLASESVARCTRCDFTVAAA